MGTRAALLDSAERLSRTRGYCGFSYADLSEEVGIRKASIHHHFPTKADLALALIERYCERFAEGLEATASDYPRAADRLRAYLEGYRKALAEGEMVCLCVAFSAGRDSFSAPVFEELVRFDEGSVAWLREQFSLATEDGSVEGVVDPEAEARGCLALVEGAQLLARATKDVGRFDSATDLLARRLR